MQNSSSNWKARTFTSIQTECDRLLELFGGDGDGAVELIEAEDAELRAIGFHVHYETAQDFLQRYLNILREMCAEWINNPPKLRDQVENDPAVMAAKQAYGMACEAYDMAREQARMKLQREALHIVERRDDDSEEDR